MFSQCRAHCSSSAASAPLSDSTPAPTSTPWLASTGCAVAPASVARRSCSTVRLSPSIRAASWIPPAESTCEARLERSRSAALASASTRRISSSWICCCSSALEGSPVSTGCAVVEGLLDLPWQEASRRTAVRAVARWIMVSSWLGRAALAGRAWIIGRVPPFLDACPRLDGVQPRPGAPGPWAGTTQGEARPDGAGWNPLRVHIPDIDWNP